MNTCIINNIQTVSQDRLPFFTLGQKMKMALSLDFFLDYISMRDQVTVTFFGYIILLCDSFLFFYLVVTHVQD
jgi:hypothetical protein